MSDISDEKQHQRLSEDWRQIHNVIWQIPSVSLSIITGVVFVAYNLEGWIRVLALGIGSIFLFSMTVEIVKKRLTMDAVSYRMQRLELKHKSESKLSFEPFPSRTPELMEEFEKLKNEKEKQGIKTEGDPGPRDPVYLLFKFSNARACLTTVLFVSAILISIATYIEFIRQMNFEWSSYVIGLIPVVAFSIIFVKIRRSEYKKYKDKTS